MTRKPALEAIRDCVQTVLQLTSGEASGVSAETTPVDLPRWTSLAHVQLVLEIERTFDVTFDADEIAALASVKAILDALDRRGVR
jgi:acyl carrier protein